jgi:hypothetical protein
VAATVPQQQPTYVLSVEAVRWGLATLEGQKIHPFFIAYLFLCKWAAEQDTTTDIEPAWPELATYLEIRGGPPAKPFYRPFWHSTVNDPGRYWLNRNLAGSFAPSSLRNVPARVIDVFDGRFSLKPEHGALALTHLLYGQPVSAVALASFLYRDYGFVSDDGSTPTHKDVRLMLARDFRHEDFHPMGFRVSDRAPLFTNETSNDVEKWFVALDADTAGVE